MDLIEYLGYPPKREYKKTARGHFARTTSKMPEKWPFGRRTTAQCIKAFEEEAKALINS
jgi:hypothetical protein